MKFLMIILAVRFIISLMNNNKPAAEVKNEKNNEVRDPAAFQLR